MEQAGLKDKENIQKSYTNMLNALYSGRNNDVNVHRSKMNNAILNYKTHRNSHQNTQTKLTNYVNKAVKNGRLVINANGQLVVPMVIN